MVNVSSAREFRANLWQPDVFIRSHSTKAMVDKMNNGELESKEIDGQMNYLVETSFIYAIGQNRNLSEKHVADVVEISSVIGAFHF